MRSHFNLDAMQSLHLLFAGVCLCVPAACAGPRAATDSEPAVLQTTSGYGNAHFRTYWDDGESVYVRISEEAPAAVLLDGPGPFASPVASLYFGQRLEVIDDSTTNYVHVSTTGMDDHVRGWVWRPLIASRVPLYRRGGEDRLEAEGAEYASTILNEDGVTFRSSGLYKPAPEEAWEQSNELRRVIERVDEFESARARVMGPHWHLDRYREFGKAGGLLDD